MATEVCAGCGRSVRIAGGAGTLWSFDNGGSEGMTLELVDGSDEFLCFTCIEALPETPTAADVAALPEREEGQSVGDGGGEYVIAGLVVGGILAVIATLVTGNPGLWGAAGFAVGFAAVVAGGRLTEVRTD